MKVKVIRGSVQYNGVVYGEGMEIAIEPEHFAPLAEVVEVLEEESAEGTASAPEDKTDYAAMKKEELTALAEERGIKIPASANKEAIIQLLSGKSNE